MSSIPLVQRAHPNVDRVAIVDELGSWSYRQLLDQSAAVAARLLDGTSDLGEQRVAFLVPSGFDYVRVQWGIWRAGGIAVPLATMHPPAELAYTIEDSGASVVVAHPTFADTAGELARQRDLRFVRTDELDVPPCDMPTVDATRRAMMCYTSGTTNRPKGVVTTHANIAAQITALVEAWEWTASDRILHFLPLHHVHGIINVLSCALWSGACCEFHPQFEAAAVWSRLSQPHELTLFMAVPTIYARLIAAWEAADDPTRRAMSDGCQRLRLMVSGSAALPVSTLDRWREISGHTLLERYGMTEIGMALSNALHGRRHAGCVGCPLPGVEVRLVDEQGQAIVDDEVAGEIHVRGPAVFAEYWQRPAATRDAFTSDGWFKTGDISSRTSGVYRILGRDSVDIIKTGGYKVSALEIEEVLRRHDAIDQCAVVGVDDAEWGERVCAAVVCHPGDSLDLTVLRDWAKDQLAPYKIPSRLKILNELPRNAMGKVTKPAVKTFFD